MRGLLQKFEDETPSRSRRLGLNATRAHAHFDSHCVPEVSATRGLADLLPRSSEALLGVRAAFFRDRELRGALERELLRRLQFRLQPAASLCLGRLNSGYACKCL